MDPHLKHRLVGASVLAALAVIFIPMWLDDTPPTANELTETNIPPRPDADFGSSIVPLDESMPTPVVTPPPELPGSAGADLAPRTQSITPTPIAPGAGQQRVGVTAWVVQVGSFGSEENAVALERRLKGQGYTAFVEAQPDAAGSAYKVRIGPELLRADAQAVRDRLERELELKGIVVRYP
jgi:DedD protein